MKKFKVSGKFDIDKDLGISFEEFENSLKEDRLKESLKFKYLYGEINPYLEGRKMEDLLTTQSKDFVIHKVKTNKKDESFEIIVVAANVCAFDMINTAYQSASHDIHASIRSVVDPKEKTMQTVTFDIIIKKLEQPSDENQLKILVRELSEAEEEMKNSEKKLKELEEEKSKLKELIKIKKKEIDKLLKEKVKLDKNNKESK